MSEPDVKADGGGLVVSIRLFMVMLRSATYGRFLPSLFGVAEAAETTEMGRPCLLGKMFLVLAVQVGGYALSAIAATELLSAMTEMGLSRRAFE